MKMDEPVRIDKWLWAIRAFKTRSLASEACRAGKIKIDGHAVKPSYEVKLNGVITITHPPIEKTFKVLALLKNRVGAKLVPEYAADLTPQSEYDRLKTVKSQSFEYREHGIGRPTKKHRRLIDYLKGDAD